MKSIYLVCDKDKNPFFTTKTGDRYRMVWAFKSPEEAKDSCTTPEDTIVEFRPVKAK